MSVFLYCVPLFHLSNERYNMFANTKQQLLPGGDATASCRPERNMVVVYLGNTAVFTTVTVKKIAALPPG